MTQENQNPIKYTTILQRLKNTKMCKMSHEIIKILIVYRMIYE